MMFPVNRNRHPLLKTISRYPFRMFMMTIIIHPRARMLAPPRPRALRLAIAHLSPTLLRLVKGSRHPIEYPQCPPGCGLMNE